MQLTDYPRPPEDNARGVHWASSPYEWGKREWSFWSEQLLAMQIKWVKIIDDGGGSGLRCARQLIDIGVMPIVRFYRPQQNPGSIGSRGAEAVRKYAAAGAVYFETNNEPDLDLEWKGGHKPGNWLEVVVNDWIADANIVLSEGGYPAFPAFGVGTQRDPFALVVQKGRPDLFDKGAWIAIHNYALARPLEYPNDQVNLEGEPITQQEWQAAGGMWAWETDMDSVNRARAANSNPYATIETDSTCFRAYEQVDELVRLHFGHGVPIITTEGGYNVGQRAGTTAGDDIRYAKPTPQAASDLTMRMFRFMDGSETVLGQTVPPYYFACCPWLIAAYRIGVWAAPAENQGPWFTDKYNDEWHLRGELPLVQMLKETPPRVRQEGPVPAQWTKPDWEQELGAAWDNRLKYLGVKLDVSPMLNGLHWKLVEAHWQDEDETIGGAGYIFVKALDENDAPIENAVVAMTRPDTTDLVRTKGAIDGFWGNYAMNGTLGLYNVWMDGHPSDAVTGLGLGLEDNPAVWTHTAFRLTFRLTAGEGILMFDHNACNAKFLAAPGTEVALPYQIKIDQVASNRYRCIGLHHLTAAENGMNHHVFLDVLDEKGKRINGATIAWDWVGRKATESARPVVIDKPISEPGTNIGLGLGQIATVWVSADGGSDKVSNLRNDWDSDGPGNDRGHHSFYVVFQRGATAPVPPPVPVAPTDTTTDKARIENLECRIQDAVTKLETARIALSGVIDMLKAA